MWDIRPPQPHRIKNVQIIRTNIGISQESLTSQVSTFNKSTTLY
ncbi:hypothetical protein DM2_789 [Halorubrum sp. DM2]|nr:hypothetical protein DM2_789 [Halorubrum sp. DM2]